MMKMKKRELKSLSKKFKLLGEFKRLDIINELSNGDKMGSYLKTKLKIESTLFSHHISNLVQWGYVDRLPAGKARKYALTKECPDLEKLANVLNN